MAKLPLAKLTGVLGKFPDDDAVKKLVASAGKAKVTKDHIVAKEAFFEYALSAPEGQKKKVLSTLFLYPGADIPKGFAFSSRDALLASLPPPTRSWVIGRGSVPVETAGVAHDTWDVDGFEVRASYSSKTGEVRNLTISLPDDAMGGGSLTTHPLHFETKPADAVPDADLTASALLAAWAIEKHGLSKKHDNAIGMQFAKRAITPRRFVIEACGRNLTTLDVAPKLSEFLSTYTDNTHHDDKGGRDKTSKSIQKLLQLKKADSCSYSADYLGTFKDVCENPFHVPDSWDAVDRIAPIIEARMADYEKTKFLTSPDVKIYEQAVKKRDAVKVTPERTTLATPSVDDALAEELVGLIGRPLADKQVKAVLTRAGLPIGKRIDEQANPAAGISYMGAKSVIEGKNQLGVDDVGFYANKYKTYIRGIGAEVEFVGFTGQLPKGVRIGDTRDGVAKKLGKPAKTRDERDWWEPSANRKIMCEFKAGKLVHIKFFIPPDY